MSSLHPRLQIKIIGIGLLFFALLVWGIASQHPTPQADSFSVTPNRCATFQANSADRQSRYTYAIDTSSACPTSVQE